MQFVISLIKDSLKLIPVLEFLMVQSSMELLKEYEKEMPEPQFSIVQSLTKLYEESLIWMPLIWLFLLVQFSI